MLLVLSSIVFSVASRKTFWKYMMAGPGPRETQQPQRHVCALNCSITFQFHNLARSFRHHRSLRNHSFPHCPVISCPSWARIIHPCLLFNTILPRLFLSTSSIFPLHVPCEIVFAESEDLRQRQTTLISDSWPGTGVHQIFQWLRGAFCVFPYWLYGPLTK